MQTAKEILLAKGRGYLYKKKYPQVVIFTRAIVEVDKLEQCFGGHHYRHNTGFIWVLSNKKRLMEMLSQIAHESSAHGFESLIGGFYERHTDEDLQQMREDKACDA